MSIQDPNLCTVDPKAVNHILSHPYDYHKPEQARYNLSRVIGEGGSVVFAIRV